MKKILVCLFISCFCVIFSSQIQAQTTIGHAMQFYGTASDSKGVLQIPLDNPERKSNIGTTDITLEWWMKSNPGDNVSPICADTPNRWKSGNIIIDSSVAGTEDYGSYGVSLLNGRISFGVSNGTQAYTLCTLTAVDDGVWHHIAITRNLNGLIFIFIDGLIETQYQGPQGNISYHSGRTITGANDPYLIIGGNKRIAGEVNRSFVGMIDEMRISKVQRYNDSFLPPTTPFTSDNNTVMLFHFEDCDDNTVLDSAANPLNPTILYGGNPAGPIHVISTAPIMNTPGLYVCATPTVAVSCPLKIKGDSNCDGKVNLEDFEIWRKEFTGTLETKNADFTNDLQVSLADFEVWRKGFLN